VVEPVVLGFPAQAARRPAESSLGSSLRLPADSSAVSQRSALGVSGYACANQNQDPLDEAPHRSESQGQDRHDDLGDANAGIAQVEAVDAETTEQDPEDPGHDLALGGGINHWVAGRVPG